MSKALQIWSHTFCKEFDRLPLGIQNAIKDKVDEMGSRLGSFAHYQMSGRSQYRLPVRDYRVIYTVDYKEGVIALLYVGHRRDIYK